ncbi:trichome birefringence-like protein 7 [Tanacetum coccineum]
MVEPVTAMHVTPMGSFRSDAHVGTWSDNPTVPDSSHWCLPGAVVYDKMLSLRVTVLVDGICLEEECQHQQPVKKHPVTSSEDAYATSPYHETRPYVSFNPTTPQKDARCLTLPPVSRKLC